jgi:SAM-dependent methyltransferase
MSFLSLRGSHPPVPEKAGFGMTSSDAFQQTMLRLVLGNLKKDATVLDLGAGAGLFSQSLLDHGYKVVSADLYPEKANVPCRHVNLNTAFSDGFSEKFDAICIFEVLEHVENPRLALRECKKLLKSGGMLFVSTPDASGLYSRIKFALTGEFAMFNDAMYESIGHITPISYWQICKMFAELELTVVKQVDFDGSADVPRTLGDAMKILFRLFRPFMAGHVGRQVMAFACRTP